MIVFVHNLVTKDFWLKLFSLVLAILIWLTVKFSIGGEGPTSPWLALLGQPADEMTLRDVSVHVPTSGSQIFTVDPTTVDVTLHGDPKLLKDLRKQDIQAQVDLAGIESASGLLRPVEIILPAGVSYTRIKPEQVEVRVSPKNQ